MVAIMSPAAAAKARGPRKAVQQAPPAPAAASPVKARKHGEHSIHRETRVAVRRPGVAVGRLDGGNGATGRPCHSAALAKSTGATFASVHGVQSGG